MTAKTSTRRPAAALRRSLLENLENRQLMSVTSAAINFQPGGPATPAGMTADYGSAFSWQFGKQYGWSSNNRGNAVERYSSADNEHDTFAKVATNAKWEIAVKNGTYAVKVLAGDASAYDSKYAFKVENTTVVNAAPTNGSRWVSGTQNVTVTDGRLTLTTAAGAYNAKVNSIRFNLVGTAPAPTTPAPTAPAPTGSKAPRAATNVAAVSTGSSSARITWTDNTSNESGYVVERSTNGSAFTGVGFLYANATSYNDTRLNTGQTYSYRIKTYSYYGTVYSGVATVKVGGGTAAPAPAPTTPGVVKPAAPTGTWATTVARNSIKVNWANTANETGFIVEKSTNNSSWSEAARVGKDVTDVTLTGLTYSTKFYFRVKAFNTAGASAAGPVATATTAAPTATGAGNPTSPTPTPVPSTPNAPTGNDGINPFVMSGIVNNEVPLSRAKPAMDQLGIKSVRLWYSVGSWTNSPNQGDINRAMEHKRAGYTVTLAVVAYSPTDYNTAKAYFQRLMAAPNAKNAVDYWEIGNEVNHTPYWRGSLQTYVTNYLKPAWDVLHAQGEKVIGAGVTWDVNALKTLVTYGYLNYCDYAGFHPYGENGQAVADRTYAAKAAIGNKPLIITEWNIRLMSDMNRWANELNIAARAMSQTTFLSYYYALEVDYSVASTGKGGVIFSNGARNTPFWNTIYNWTH